MANIRDLLHDRIKKQINEKSFPVNGAKVEFDPEKAKTVLQQQAKAFVQEQENDWGFLDALDQPTYHGSRQKNVRVTYDLAKEEGVLGYVDLSFSTLDPSLNEVYPKVLSLIEEMSVAKSAQRAQVIANQLADLGEPIIELLFREVRMFKYSIPLSYELYIQLLVRLIAYSLKGRMLLKAILMHGTNNDHIELAIRVAGRLQEKQVIPEILEHSRNMDLFIACMYSFIHLRDTEAIISWLPSIERIDPTRKDIIDEALKLARQFSVFETKLLHPLFQAYVSCTKRQLRPIYSVALKSFGAELIPVMEKIIYKATDSYTIRLAAQLIGGTKEESASQTLKKMLYQHPDKQTQIIEGMAHTQDPLLLPTIVEILQKSQYRQTKQACLKTIGSLADKRYISLIESYADEPDYRCEAIYSLIRLQAPHAWDLYFDIFLHGSPEEQQIMEGLTSLLTTNHFLQIAQKMLNLPDQDLVRVFAVLQRPHLLPKQMGQYLKQLLDRNPSSPVRLEIYRLIAKFANTKHELLSQHILFEAIASEKEEMLKSELELLIQRMKQNKAEVGTNLK